MLNIIKSDFYKLKKSKAFWVCTILCVVFAVLMVTALNVGMNRALANLDSGDPEMMQMAEMAENISGISALQEFLPMGFNIIFIGVFVAIFVSSEFGYGTMKNTLSRGADRIKVFFSKFVVCSCAALVMLLAFIAAMLAAGSIAWGFDPTGIVTFSGMLGMISLQSLLVIAYTALFVFISMTMRGTGGAIATNIICVTMASTLLGAISMLFGGSINLSDYWLEWGLSKFAVMSPPSGDIIQGILIALGWGIASLAAGTTLFKKIDVK